MQEPGRSQTPEPDQPQGTGTPPRPGDSDPSTFETTAVSSTLPLDLSSRSLAVLGRRYDILGEAGRGAMGQVFKARDRETGEVIALKILKSEIASDKSMIERFKSELLFARKVTHKNVCRVYEFNRVDGIAYTSMEFVEGESLRSVLRRFGSLTQRKTIELALQICSGLKEAHAQGIVHRDLKPENVMIDTHGNVKIMDFGIARSMEALTLSTGALIGTPAYMAPEQAAGKPVDYRADIYALGLMLYEMCTGVQAFRGDNAISVALKHINEVPKPPREIEPSISPAIERAILRCLEKDPDNRFQSIAELESDLGSAAPGAFGTQVFAGGSTGAVEIPALAAGAQSIASPAHAARTSKRSRVAKIVLVLALTAFGARILWRHAFPAAGKVDISDEKVDVSVPGASIHVAPEGVSITKAEPTKAPDAAKTKPSRPPTAISTHPSETVSAGPGHAKTRIEQAATPTPLAAPAAVQPLEPPSPPSAPGNGAPATRESARNPRAASSQNTAASEDVPEPAAPVAKGGGYIWVNRFPRQVGAQNAAQKIEGMGLPVTIIPRHNAANDSQFFVVLSGPFPVTKLDNVIRQLKGNGFALARPNRAAAAAKDPGAGENRQLRPAPPSP